MSARRARDTSLSSTAGSASGPILIPSGSPVSSGGAGGGLSSSPSTPGGASSSGSSVPAGSPSAVALLGADVVDARRTMQARRAQDWRLQMAQIRREHGETDDDDATTDVAAASSGDGISPALSRQATAARDGGSFSSLGSSSAVSAGISIKAKPQQRRSSLALLSDPSLHSLSSSPATASSVGSDGHPHAHAHGHARNDSLNLSGSPQAAAGHVALRTYAGSGLVKSPTANAADPSSPGFGRAASTPTPRGSGMMSSSTLRKHAPSGADGTAEAAALAYSQSLAAQPSRASAASAFPASSPSAAVTPSSASAAASAAAASAASASKFVPAPVVTSLKVRPPSQPMLHKHTHGSPGNGSAPLPVVSAAQFTEERLSFPSRSWRWTLRFPDAELESHFIVTTYPKALWQLRFLVVVLLIGNAIAGVTSDLLVYKAEHRPSIWSIRYALITPLCILFFLWTRSRLFFRWRQLSTFAFCSLSAAAFMWISAVGQEPNHGIFMVLSWSYALFTSLHFLHGCALWLLLLMGFGLTDYLVDARGVSDSFVLSFGYLFVTAISLALMCYFLESSFRNAFLQMARLGVEQRKTNAVLYNILPLEIARNLIHGVRSADYFPSASILFCELTDFRWWSSHLPAARLVRLLNDVFTSFDQLTDAHAVLKVETIGEIYMCASGLPRPSATHAQACADLALDMRAQAEHSFWVELEAEDALVLLQAHRAERRKEQEQTQSIAEEDEEVDAAEAAATEAEGGDTTPVTPPAMQGGRTAEQNLAAAAAARAALDAPFSSAPTLDFSSCDLDADPLAPLADGSAPPPPSVRKRIVVRIGIHSGMVVAGVIGFKLPRYRLFGDVINTASRMQSTALPGTIQLSSDTRALLGDSGFDVQCRGEINVKGKGVMTTHFLIRGAKNRRASMLAGQQQASAAAASAASAAMDDIPDTIPLASSPSTSASLSGGAGDGFGGAAASAPAGGSSGSDALHARSHSGVAGAGALVSSASAGELESLQSILGLGAAYHGGVGVGSNAAGGPGGLTRRRAASHSVGELAADDSFGEGRMIRSESTGNLGVGSAAGASMGSDDSFAPLPLRTLGGRPTRIGGGAARTQGVWNQTDGRKRSRTENVTPFQRAADGSNGPTTTATSSSSSSSGKNTLALPGSGNNPPSIYQSRSGGYPAASAVRRGGQGSKLAVQPLEMTEVRLDISGAASAPNTSTGAAVTAGGSGPSSRSVSPGPASASGVPPRHGGAGGPVKARRRSQIAPASTALNRSLQRGALHAQSHAHLRSGTVLERGPSNAAAASGDFLDVGGAAFGSRALGRSRNISVWDEIEAADGSASSGPGSLLVGEGALAGAAGAEGEEDWQQHNQRLMLRLASASSLFSMQAQQQALHQHQQQQVPASSAPPVSSALSGLSASASFGSALSFEPGSLPSEHGGRRSSLRVASAAGGGGAFPSAASLSSSSGRARGASAGGANFSLQGTGGDDSVLLELVQDDDDAPIAISAIPPSMLLPIGGTSSGTRPQMLRNTSLEAKALASSASASASASATAAPIIVVTPASGSQSAGSPPVLPPYPPSAAAVGSPPPTMLPARSAKRPSLFLAVRGALLGQTEQETNAEAEGAPEARM